MLRGTLPALPAPAVINHAHLATVSAATKPQGLYDGHSRHQGARNGHRRVCSCSLHQGGRCGCTVVGGGSSTAAPLLACWRVPLFHQHRALTCGCQACCKRACALRHEPPLPTSVSQLCSSAQSTTASAWCACQWAATTASQPRRWPVPLGPTRCWWRRLHPASLTDWWTTWQTSPRWGELVL